ncbi:MAG: VOC family protein [Myxococcota bacterium]
MGLTPFHLAVQVTDLSTAEGFYRGTLGCGVGRRDARWIDFDFFGHQLTTHLVAERAVAEETNPVDGDAVPVPHFGVVLPRETWEALAARLRDGGAPFRIEPRVRFEGAVGEQGTFFLEDPAGNVLEFKTVRDLAQLFATERA